MFEQSLLQIDPRESARRRATAAASITLQAGMLAIFLLVPLLAPQVLPDLVHAPTMPVIFNLRPQPVELHSGGGAGDSANLAILVENVREFTAPSTMPSHAVMLDDGDAAPSSPFFSTHGAGGPLPNALSNVVRLPDKPKGPVVVSHLDEGMLIHRVDPLYPAIARANRIQGQVTLDAIISKEGTIENLRAVSGQPMLVPAALDAVRQWRYRPYLLNGSPVEVETHITVNFHID
jgi:periplasmic protein TonB